MTGRTDRRGRRRVIPARCARRRLGPRDLRPCSARQDGNATETVMKLGGPFSRGVAAWRIEPGKERSPDEARRRRRHPGVAEEASPGCPGPHSPWPLCRRWRSSSQDACSWIGAAAAATTEARRPAITAAAAPTGAGDATPGLRLGGGRLVFYVCRSHGSLLRLHGRRPRARRERGAAVRLPGAHLQPRRTRGAGWPGRPAAPRVGLRRALWCGDCGEPPFTGSVTSAVPGRP